MNPTVTDRPGRHRPVHSSMLKYSPAPRLAITAGISALVPDLQKLGSSVWTANGLLVSLVGKVLPHVWRLETLGSLRREHSTVLVSVVDVMARLDTNSRQRGRFAAAGAGG